LVEKKRHFNKKLAPGRWKSPGGPVSFPVKRQGQLSFFWVGGVLKWFFGGNLNGERLPGGKIGERDTFLP